jgi:hypothetical protein
LRPGMGRDILGERMTRFWPLVLALIPVALYAQPIYTWIGPRGTVHYADHPHPGARRVELGAAQGFTLHAPPSTGTGSDSSAPPRAPAPLRHPTLRILSPANGASLFNIGGRTQATVRAQGLLPGEDFVYELDGKRVAGPTTSSRVLLEHVWRGTHRLTVLLLSPSGQVLARARSVFYVHQHSILLHPHPAPVVRAPMRIAARL